VTVTLKVTGVREMVAAYRKAGDDVERQAVRKVLPVAERIAQDAARRTPRRSGRAAGSIRARSTSRGASVTGGADVPYFGWLDFGGAVGRNASVERPYIATGRYIFPAVDAAEKDIEGAVADGIEAAATGAGFETRGF
jgi:hypothetical protein